jgi:Flp pilus assembly protein TadD
MSEESSAINNAIITAEALANSGNYVSAIAQIQRQLALTPNCVPLLNFLSWYHVQIGRSDEAVTISSAAIAAAPDDGGAHRILSIALGARQETLNSAIAHASIATRLQPENSSAHLQLARVLLSARRMKEAAASFRAAVDHAPDCPWALTGYANFLNERPLPIPEARRLITRALQIDPSNTHVLVVAGRIELRLGDVEEARNFARSALALKATDSEAIKLMAEIKMARNLVFGLTWRFMSWGTRMPRWLFIATVVCGLELLSFTTIFVAAFGPKSLGDASAVIVSFSIEALVVLYCLTPIMLRRWISAETRTIGLKKDF